MSTLLTRVYMQNAVNYSRAVYSQLLGWSMDGMTNSLARKLAPGSPIITCWRYVAFFGTPKGRHCLLLGILLVTQSRVTESTLYITFFLYR